jgi:hypothetical protein
MIEDAVQKNNEEPTPSIEPYVIDRAEVTFRD